MNNVTVKVKTEELRNLIKKKGYSLQQASIILGKSKNYFTECFKRNVCGVDELSRICSLLKVKADDYIEPEEEPEEEQEKSDGKVDDNVIELLLGIYKALQENKAAIKDTNLKLNEIIARMNNINHYNKTTAENIQKIEKNSQYFIRGNGKGI